MCNLFLLVTWHLSFHELLNYFACDLWFHAQAFRNWHYPLFSLIVARILNFASHHFCFSRSSSLPVNLPIITHIWKLRYLLLFFFLVILWESNPCHILSLQSIPISSPFFFCFLFISIAKELLVACFNFISRSNSLWFLAVLTFSEYFLTSKT